MSSTNDGDQGVWAAAAPEHQHHLEQKPLIVTTVFVIKIQFDLQIRFYRVFLCKLYFTRDYRLDWMTVTIIVVASYG